MYQESKWKTGVLAMRVLRCLSIGWNGEGRKGLKGCMRKFASFTCLNERSRLLSF